MANMTRTKRTMLRLVALVGAAVGMGGWLALRFASKSWEEPLHLGEVTYRLLLLIAPILAFLILLGIVHSLLRNTSVPEPKRTLLRVLSFALGPIGSAGAIFYLTAEGISNFNGSREQRGGDASDARQPSNLDHQ